MTDTMNKNRIQGLCRRAREHWIPNARFSWRCLEGKFGVGCEEVLSLIPGGPSFCPRGLSEPRGGERERRESAEGVVACANLCA